MIHLDFDEDQLTAIVERAVNKAFAARTNKNNEPAPEGKTLYSIRELADFIGCSTVTAQKLKNEGKIPFRQVNRKVLFNTVEVLKAMDQGKRKNQ